MTPVGIVLRVWWVLVPLLSAGPIRGQDVKSSVTLDATDVRLSGSVFARFTVEGPTPLRVTVPTGILAEESVAAWKLRGTEGPTITDLSNGRQSWTLRIRLDPYVQGEAVRLSFTPFEVVAGSDPTSQSLPWPAQSIRVWTVASTTDDVQVTGIESLPLAPVSGANWTGPILALSAVVVAAGVIGFVRYRRRRRPVLSADELVELKLGQAEDGAAVAEAVRGYVEAVYTIPATRLTTAELKAQLNGMPDEAGRILLTLLENCDAAKFARELVDRTGLIEQAREFLAKTCTDSAG